MSDSKKGKKNKGKSSRKQQQPTEDQTSQKAQDKTQIEQINVQQTNLIQINDQKKLQNVQPQVQNNVQIKDEAQDDKPKGQNKQESKDQVNQVQTQSLNQISDNQNQTIEKQNQTVQQLNTQSKQIQQNNKQQIIVQANIDKTQDILEHQPNQQYSKSEEPILQNQSNENNFEKEHIENITNINSNNSESKDSQKIIQTDQPIILISTSSNPSSSNQDLDAQTTTKQSKPSKRLAKFKQKQKKSLPKSEQKSPQPQIQPQSKSHIFSTLKSKFIKPSKEQQFFEQKDLDQYKMLSMMIQSKKRQNYKNLKQWDDNRVNELSLHINVINSLEKSLELLNKTSYENIEIYISTFRQIYNQHQKYSTHPMIDSVYSSSKNSFSQNIYINCSCIVNALNEQNMQRSKKSKQFSEFIENNVLIGILQTHVNNSRSVLSNIKIRVSGLKKILIDAQDDLEIKTQKLVKSFSNNILQLSENTDQDFYQSQLDFLRTAHSIVILHKQYADLILQYYSIIKDIEVERANVIKKALKTYSQGLQHTFQSKTGKQSLQQLTKGQQIKLIEQFLSLEQLLPPNLQQDIKKKISVVSQGFLIEHLKQYFRSFEYQKFDLRQLILKQYPVTNKTANRQNSSIIISVDKFVHIFSNLQDYAQPTASYKIDSLLKLKRKGNQIQFQTISQKRGGVLGMFGWSKKSEGSTIVSFLKKDSAQQVEDYIRKLI